MMTLVFDVCRDEAIMKSNKNKQFIPNTYRDNERNEN